MMLGSAQRDRFHHDGSLVPATNWLPRGPGMPLRGF